MSGAEFPAEQARQDLYSIMQADAEFENKAEQALELGKEYLGVDNGHLTRIDEGTDHWQALISTDPSDGDFPPGLELDLGITYCRKTIESDGPIALSDAPEEGWEDDPAFNEHGLHCYHGNTLILNGQPYGTICFVSNEPRSREFRESETFFADLITRLLERELKLEQYETQLTRQSNLSNVLDRIIRHNLRNDMTIIRGYTEMMNEVVDDLDYPDKALRNIDDLLDLSEKARELNQIIGASGEQRHIDLGELVEETVKEIKSEYPQATYSTEIEDNVDATVFPTFHRAVEELIENAAKHSGHSPTIEITVERVPNAVEIHVQDDGPGLSDQDQAVFTTGVESPLVHGSGLGLWIVHWIVTGHDGVADVSVTEEGSTMSITVPVGPKVDQNQKTAKIQRARDRYQAAFEESNDAMVIFNDEAKILEANPESEHIFGVDRQALMGRSIREFLPTEYDFETAWARFKDGGKTDTVEFIRADGESRTIEYTAKPDVVPDHHFVIYRDVTERKEHEQELERLLELLEHTERIGDVAGWEIDPKTRDVFWSEQLFEMLEWEDDQEPPLEDALDVYVAEDRPVVKNAVEDALAAGEPFAVEARYQRQDGDTRWFDIRGEPTIENGEVVTLRGAVNDVTERKQREQVLREIHDIISDQHLSFEEQVRALLQLGRAELGTKYGTLSKIRGKEYVFEFVAGEDDSIESGNIVPVSATNCEIVASTQKTVVLGDVERDAPEETDRAGFTEWGISTYIGAPVVVEDDVHGTFCFYGTNPRSDQFSNWEQTLVDLMSDWVSHEIQRKQAKQRSKEQNNQLDQFSSVVSHDLRNQLNVAQSHLELAQEEDDREHLDAIGDAQNRMGELIEDLLTLAQEGDEVGELDAVNLARLTRSCWENVTTGEAALFTEIDRQVRGDPVRLKQLIENLIRNAAEHGGEDLTITIGELADGFYIEDTGRGIPEEKRDELFEVGYSTSEDGTGLGLNIVKQIATAHGWEIEVTDGSDGGARFEITGVEFAT